MANVAGRLKLSAGIAPVMVRPFHGCILALAFLLLPCLACAQSTQSLLSGPVEPAPQVVPSLLIRNVQIIDRDGQTENVTVSILIQQGQLDLVSTDKIPATEARLVIDARQGVLLGQLALGEPATFMILDKDPREDFRVLLDTATHARLAIHRGAIVKNTFANIAEQEADKEVEKRSGWIAYSPPPLSLPTAYQDNSKWNKWQSKYIDGLFAAAIALDRQSWVSQDDDSSEQVGSLTDFEGGEIRAYRLGVVGTLNFTNPWTYTVFGATHAFDRGFDSGESDSFSLFDYRLDIPLPRQVTMSVGKQKEPISMERIMSMVQLPQQERSAPADGLLPSRNVGIVFSGNLAHQRSTWAGGVFNDWFDTNDNLNDSATQLVGRITGLPYLSSNENNLVHLGAAVRYSNNREGARALTEPEFNQSPLFVDTGVFDADSTTTWQAESSFRSGPVWLAGEYLISNTDAPQLNNPSLSGYHLSASWIVTGEMRAYNKRAGIMSPVPIARSVYQNGIGAWELGARYSHTDLTDGSLDGGKMDIWSLAADWWLSPFMNISINYRFISLDKDGIVGRSNGFNTRLLLLLE